MRRTHAPPHEESPSTKRTCTVRGGDGRSAEDNDDSGGGNGGGENGDCGEDKEAAEGRTQGRFFFSCAKLA